MSQTLKLQLSIKLPVRYVSNTKNKISQLWKMENLQKVLARYKRFKVALKKLKQ